MTTSMCPHCFARFGSLLELSDHLRDDGDAGKRCSALVNKIKTEDEEGEEQ